MNDDKLNEETILRFENMLKTNKILFFDSEEFEDLILHYLDSGKLNLSKKALKLALEQHPNSIGIKLVHSEVLIFENKFEKAIVLLNELEQLDPENEDIYFHKSMIYSKQGDHKASIRMLEKAFLYAEDHSEVYMLIGLEYLFLEDFDKALYYFKKCLKHNPHDHSALLNIIYCFEINDRYTDAIQYLESFLDDNPYNELAWQQLGKQLYVTKDYESAVNAFDMAIVVDEYFSGAYIEKGKALEKCDRYQEAIINYKELMKIEESSAFVLARIGYCYDKCNEYKYALYYYLKAVHEDPLYERTWIYITDLYIRHDKFTKALHFINKALSIDEQNYTYWRRFAIINKELKFWDDAELGFRKAVEFGDKYKETYLLWTEVLIELKEEKIALTHLKIAFNLYPDSPTICFRLAGLYFLINQPVNGMIFLKKALDMDTNKYIEIALHFPEVWKLGYIRRFVNQYNNDNQLN